MNGSDVPPLDKIPTNEFIEKFLEEDADNDELYIPSPVRTKTVYTSKGVTMTNGFEAAGRSVKSAALGRTHRRAGSKNGRTLVPIEDRDDLETVLDITGELWLRWSSVVLTLIICKWS